MPVTDYTKATYEAIESGVTVHDALGNLRKVLARRGHQKLEGKIHRALLRYATQKAVDTTPTVTVVKAGAEKNMHKEIVAVLQALGTAENPTISEDDSLIGGFTVRQGSKYHDRSHKGKLISLYRNITKNQSVERSS